MKPRIAINISNCVAGGGFQIAVWFVGRMIERREALPFDATYIVNEKHVPHLDMTGLDAVVVSASPMRSLAARRRVTGALADRKFDLVFSLFGPSGFDHPLQVSGVANAFITSLSRRTLQEIFPRTWPLQYVRYALFGRSIARCRALVFETQGERDRFAHASGFPLERTHVIPNSVNDVFPSSGPVAAPPLGTAPRFLFVTGNQPHKNNWMIPAYILALRRAGLASFKFAVTIGDDEAGGWLDAAVDRSHLEFLGSLTPARLLDEYRKCHVVVQASSLETYSAVYNETRFIPRALLASDRPFAREICGDFARFFEPLDADSFARAALALLPSLAAAESASWDARNDVLLPEERFRRLVDVMLAELKILRPGLGS